MEDKSGESTEGKVGVRGERAEVEASGEGVGVGVLNNSGGIDSKGLGGPDEYIVRTRMGV